MTGPKVREFAHLIEYGGDRDRRDPRVVIDRHALSVAHGRALHSDEFESAPLSGYRRRDGTVSCSSYDRVANLYIEAASLVSATTCGELSPHHVQAVTWLVRQRLNENAQQQRGLTALDKGRRVARANAEKSWLTFCRNHLPHLDFYPRTGYRAI
ncbi:hypothetical protein [Allokutzneria sp. NRRL B-24872]|uniref:DUF7178 family protein n=1 Tax=Allokutzneria sp. NRRL B-24872 TaxID=1137961 RepID=UPI001178C2E9|nr:hypothetical protein [Allokutzneria sp. NRRL B-24872]